jgi:hypothetical protein
VFLGLYLISLVLTGLQQVSGPATLEFGGERVRVPESSLADVPLGALGNLYTWHGASFDVNGDALVPAGAPIGFDVSFSFALVLGLFLVVVALFRAGRAAAAGSDLPWWAVPVHGLQVALPYTLLALFLSPLGRVSEALPGIPAAPEGGAAFEVAASPTSVVLMAFLLATVAATAGALGPSLRAGVPRRVAAVAAGGWRMLWLWVALAVVGFLVLAALHPDITRSYLEFVSQGGALGVIRGVVTTAYLLGNVGVYVAAGATGTGLGFSALGGSCTLVSYLRFPSGVTAGPPPGSDAFADPCGALPIDFAPAPLPFLLFLLVPALATVLGGALTARRAGVVRGSEGAAVGALAAVPFALLAVIFASLASLSYEVRVFFQIEASAGPSLAPLLFLALLWGAVGGAFGGWLRGRSATPADRADGVAPDTATGPGAAPGPSA